VSKQRLYVLLGVLGVQLLIAAIVSANDFASFLDGRHDLIRILAVVGLAWSLVVAFAAAAIGRSFSDARRISFDVMSAERAVIAARQRVAHVLTEGAVDIALQPIVDLNTGRAVGVEALARFRDGRSVDEWLLEAASTGQGLAMERLTFLAALDLLDVLPDRAYLSVNSSPELLMHTSLTDDLLHGSFPLERLVIEVTEHVKINRYADLHASLARLRERGVRLAVDDTGAGYASFSHVLQLRPDIIKIDRSLISEVNSDAARRSLVTALVLLGLDLGASVTGEGVEGLNELRTIATLGVDCAQGYLLGAPTKDRFRQQRWFERDWRTLVTNARVSTPV